MSMTRIWERLYLGSLQDAADLAAANPFGITAVLSLCSRKVPYRASRINYTRIPIAESRPVSARKFEAVMGAIAQGVRHGTLLIHCRHKSLTRYDGCMAASMRLPQPRCSASRNRQASSDDPSITSVTAKRSRAPPPMKALPLRAPRLAGCGKTRGSNTQRAGLKAR